MKESGDSKKKAISKASLNQEKTQPKARKENMQHEVKKSEKSVKTNKLKTSKVIEIASAIFMALLVVVVAICAKWQRKETAGLVASGELAKAMTYEQVTEQEKAVAETNDCVRFSAFFLRDVDGDGKAESLKGTCREIGKEDTLYMEIIVQTQGKLRDAKIEIDGKNFYFQTTMPKDDEIAENAIGSNVKEISFNELQVGTQKLMSGIVRAGDYTNSYKKTEAIGNDTSKYTVKDNKVILTGTYVDGSNREHEIRKEIDLTVDWYGTVEAEIPEYIYGSTNNKNQRRDITEAVKDDEGILDLNFDIYTQETKNQLILSETQVEGSVPQLNGYDPKDVIIKGGDITGEYNKDTREFVLKRTAEQDEGKIVSKKIYDSTYSDFRLNRYALEVTYPVEAYYATGGDSVEIKIPIKTYYIGYNNEDKENFTNPYRSNTAEDIIVVTFDRPTGEVARFDIYVGKYVGEPMHTRIVSKAKPLKIYNGISSSEKEDRYIVEWRGSTGPQGNTTGMIMTETSRGEAFAGTNNMDGVERQVQNNAVSPEQQEVDRFVKKGLEEKDSMEEVTTNVGIYFSNPVHLLGLDGWIKVYDEVTDELIETFTKENWNNYSEGRPYTYDIPRKHIRIETSATNVNSYLSVYNVKELDDEYITTHYTRDQFDNLKYVQSTVTGYVGGIGINTETTQAPYQEPLSYAKVEISKYTLSTQVTEKNDIIKIRTDVGDTRNLETWKNGSFLLEFPSQILDVEVNKISIGNAAVHIVSSEKYEENGKQYIKINTENDVETLYSITIDCNITPDPRISTDTVQLNLYASNEGATDYYSKTPDIYDINNNSNRDENINKSNVSIDLIAPGSLLTNQVAKNYNTEKTVTVSPRIAEVERNTINDGARTAEIEVQLRNNYDYEVSDIQILGKIPFQGNKYALSKEDLGSTFTAKMLAEGITKPGTLANAGTIYYSEKTEPTVDTEDLGNEWKPASQVKDWGSIRSYLIDLRDYVMTTKQELVFTYKIEIPSGVAFNEVAYSHHGIIFALKTEQGKLFTQTEPNKLGFRIEKKYNLELTKYHKGKTKKVEGATYKVAEVDGEGTEVSAKTAMTDTEGKLTIKDLYAEKKYVIEEIKSPSEYELNKGKVEITTKVESNGDLGVTTKDENGVMKGEAVVEQASASTGSDYIVKVEVQDEAKANLKIVKTDKATGAKISGVRFKITGANFSENGTSITTNTSGEATLKGLTIGEIYTIEEVKAEGYYLMKEPIKFKIISEGGTYKIQKTEGTTKGESLTSDNEIPVGTIEIEDDKIPTYNLEINKVQKGETKPIVGAKLQLYKGTQKIGTYTTGADGRITVQGLYQYEEAKKIEQTYTLKEIYAPDGFAKIKDIKFSVHNENGTLKMKIEEGNVLSQNSENSTQISITVEDSPSFKLTKKDGETKTPLPGTKFAIYNVDNGTDEIALDSKFNVLGTKETINGKDYYVVTTNEKGEITADLREGLYKAVEVKASNEKYDITDNVYYFGIGANREAEMGTKATVLDTFGGTDYEGIDVLEDTKDGGFVLIGSFYSETIEVGNQKLKNYKYGTVGGWDDSIYVIKYDSDNNVQWANSFASNEFIRNDSITIENSEDGEIYLMGNFRGETIYLGESEITIDEEGYSDSVFLIGYTNQGNVKVAKAFGNGNVDSSYYAHNKLKMIDNNKLVMMGLFKEQISIEGKILGSDYSSYDLQKIFILEYDLQQDKVLWANSYEGYSLFSGNIVQLKVLKDGSLILAGNMKAEKIQIGEQELLNNSGKYSSSWSSYYYTDIYMIKYGNEGNVEWTKSIGGESDEEIAGIEESEDGDIILVGNFKSKQFQIEEQEITNVSDVDNSEDYYTSDVVSYYSDVFMVEYDSGGTLNWVKTFGGKKNEEAVAVEKLENGDIVLGGNFTSERIELEGHEIINKSKVESEKAGYSDVYIIRCNNIGDIQYASSFGSENTEEMQLMQKTKDENIIALGEYDNTEELGEYSYDRYAKDGDNRFVIKYNINDFIEYETTYKGDEITKLKEDEEGNNYLFGEASVTKIDTEGKYNWITNVKSSCATVKNGKVISVNTYQNGEVINGMPLQNNGSADVCFLQYEEIGKDGVIVEKANSIGQEGEDYIKSVKTISNGEYIAIGSFQKEITIDNKKYVSQGNSDGIIIKYDIDGNIKKVIQIGGDGEDILNDIAIDSNDNYIVVGQFDGKVIINGYTYTTNGNKNGIVVKFNNEDTIQWVKQIQGNENTINAVSIDLRGDCIVGGKFDNQIVINGTTLECENSDGLVIKYDTDGNIQWMHQLKDTREAEGILSVLATSDGGYVACGGFRGEIEFGNKTLEGNWENRTEAIIIKYGVNGNVEWANEAGGYYYGGYFNGIQELNDKSYVVSGMYHDSVPPEGDIYRGYIVKYDASGNLLLEKILTCLDEDHDESIANSVTKCSDGGFIISAQAQGSIGIDEIYLADGGNFLIKYNSSAQLQWVKRLPMTISNAVELVNGKYIVVGNSENSFTVDGNVITNAGATDGIMMELKVNNSIENNSEIEAINNVKMLKITTAVERIDGVEGGTISGQGSTRDNPYELVKYGETNNLEIKMTPKPDYEIIKVTVNGKEQEFTKDASGSYTMDKFVNMTEDKHIVVTFAKSSNKVIIQKVDEQNNPIKQEGIQFKLDQIEERTGLTTFNWVNGTDEGNFVEKNGKHETNNQGKPDTTAHSYVEIDLQECQGEYDITINTSISSEQWKDYGYANLTTSQEKPNIYDGTRIIYGMSGEEEGEEFTRTIEGGQKYYLHFLYIKDSNEGENEGTDTFTINSIRVEPNGDYLYHTSADTNSDGQIIVQLPYGKYSVKEITVPDGYKLKEEPVEITFTSGGTNTFQFENEKLGEITVHHYLKDRQGVKTKDPVADTENYKAEVGTKYKTEAHLDLPKYDLEKDTAGEYVLPGNAVGEYTKTPQDIDYYYEERKIPLIVHHYIQGTTTNVPLKDGTAQDATSSGYAGEKYNATPYSAEQLNPKYELAETPANATGTYEEGSSGVIVTYYYKAKELKITANVKKHEENNLGVITQVAGGTITGDGSTDSNPLEVVTYGETSTSTVVATPEAGYRVKSIIINGRTITSEPNEQGESFVEKTGHEVEISKFVNMTENKNIIVEFEKIQATVTVYHYIAEKKGDGTYNYTTTRVPSKNGNNEVVGDEIRQGNVGDSYTTQASTEIRENYEYLEVKGTTTGTMTEDPIEVKYYYVAKEPSITNSNVAKESTLERIVRVGQNVPYTITYKANIVDYIGDGTITIVDKLPYTIDTTQSKIGNGVYNAGAKTITWTYNVSGINTFAASNTAIVTRTGESSTGTAVDAAEASIINGNVVINKTIELIYTDVDTAEETVSNNVEATIQLTTPEVTDKVADEKQIRAEYEIDVPVAKIWNDSNNVAGKRPTEVTMVLTGTAQGGYTEAREQKLTSANAKTGDANRWEYTFRQLPKYTEAGNEITYTVSEKGIKNVDGSESIFYLATNAEVDQASHTITNQFIVPQTKVQVPVEKIWTYANEIQAKKIPESITFTLTSSDTTFEAKTLTLTPSSIVGEAEATSTKWAGAFTELPKYDANGNVNRYTVTENATGTKFYVQEGSMVENRTGVTETVEGKWTATNKFVVPNEKVQVPVEKVWEDNETQAKRRPTEITLELTSSDKTFAKKEVTINATEHASKTDRTKWEYTFTELPKYDANGDENVYTVTEKELNNKFYKQQKQPVRDETSKKITITNTFVMPEDKVQVPVEKVWTYTNEIQAKKIPESITFTITSTDDTFEARTLTLTASNIVGAAGATSTKWAGAFTELPKYNANGEENRYTVTENGTGTKFYVQEGNMVENRTEVTETIEGKWTATNKFVVPDENIQVPVSKAWNDSNNVAGKRPISVTIVLTGTGVGINSTNKITLSSLTESAGGVGAIDSFGNTIAKVNGTDNTWAYTFTNMKKYDNNGDEITYTVSEENILNADGSESIFYLATNATVDQKSHTITNKFVVPETKVQVPVEKVWEDNETQAKRRSTEITLELTSSDKTFAKREVTINATEHASKTDRTKWEYTFTELPKYDANGDENVYSVTEKELNNKFYKQQKQPVRDETSKKITITNTFVMPEDKVQVPVEKVWIYANEIQAKKIPTEITFTITSSDTSFEAKTLTLTSEDISGEAGATSTKWAGVFTELPKYNANGEENRYTVTENGTGTKFYAQEGNMVEDRTNVTETVEGKWTATNKFVVPDERIQIPVSKVWNDSNNVAGKRPTSVTIVLTGTGAGINSTNKITLSSLVGSTGGVGATDSFGNTIAKVNGEDNTWAYTFTNMKKYDNNGDEITYTVREENILNADGSESIFYLVKNATVDQKSHTIINKFVVPDVRIELPVAKHWDDNSNKAKKRSTEVTLVLTGTGEQVKTTYKVTLTTIAGNANPENNIVAVDGTEDTWYYTFTNLPKYDAYGDDIIYTIDEEETGSKFYIEKNKQINPILRIVTNKFEVPDERIKVVVTKDWRDYSNKYGKRPVQITITLKGIGSNFSYEDSKVITAEQASETDTNKWICEFTNLKRYDENGDDIAYTVDEIVPKTGEKVAVDGEILIADDFSYYDKTVSKMGELDEETYIREATITNDMTRTPGKLTTKFVDKATGDEIADKIEREQAVGTPFDVSKDRKEIEEWELVQEPDPMTGTYEEEPQTKTYYYLKKTSVLVHHYIAKENRDADGTYNGTYTYTEDRVPSKVKGQVVQDQLIPGLDTEHYDTYPSDEIQANYELVEMPRNASGEMTKEQIVVKYYYKYKMPEIEEEKVTKESSTDIVIKEDQKIDYTITYEVKFKEYMGDARIVVVDQLPYEIDFAKSYLAGGVYDEARKTITWEYEMNEINTFDEGSKHAIVSQKIELVYKNIDVTDKMIENTVTGTVRLLTPDYTSQTTDKEDIPANYIIDVPVAKVWQDNNNAKGKRPETVTMILTGTTDAGYSEEYRQVLGIANARKVAEGTGAGAINTNVWEYVFKDLPKYDEAGNIIKYEVSEETGSIYYTTENAQIEQGTRTITNVFKVPETKIKVVVTKEWQDTSNIKQKRPESLVLVLRGTGANYSKEIRQTITREDNEKQANRDEWEYTFTNLQKYDENGDEIVYTVSEEVVNANDLYYYDRVPSNAASGVAASTGINANAGVAVTALSGQNVSDISGEEIAVDSKTEENVKEATIINKMTRQPGKVTVKYVDKNNEQEISTPVEKEDAVGNDFDVREDKKEVPGYTLVGEPEEPTGKYGEEAQEKVYYYAKNTEVKVKYLERGTNKVLMTFEVKDREGKPVLDAEGQPVIQNYDVIYGYEGKKYSTEQKEIPNHTFVNSTNNTEGLMERDEIEVIYYYSPNTKVIVRYLEQDDTPKDNTDNKALKTFEAKDEKGNPVLDAEGKPVMQEYDVIYGYVGKKYKTEQEEIKGYTYRKNTENTEGWMTEDVIEVIYYYAQNTKVVVRYLEQDDTPEDNTDNLELTNVLKDEEGNIIVDENGNPKQEILKYEEEGYEGLPYKAKYKEVQDYTFVGDTGNTEGTMTKEVIEVIYYYLKNTSARVQHIDRETGKVLKEEEAEGKVGDWFRTHPEDIEDYVLVEKPEFPDVQMKKDEEVVVKYYYAHISAGVIEKHVDIITGELLAAEVQEGNEGDDYEILPKEIPGYDLVEKDEEGNSKLPENSKGKMTKDAIEVKYYYIKKATLRVQYLDKLGGEVIGQDEEGNDIYEGSKIIPDVVENKHEKDEYTTEAKEFDGYILVEIPENAEGTIEVTKNEDGSYNTETLVQYYYIKKAKVTEKHIDKATGKIIEEETHEGKEGDEYEVEPKEYPGYDLVEKDEEGNSQLPENSKGKMTEEEIVVEYYYVKRTEVKVEYVDKDTGKLLDKEEIKGHEGDKYTTEERRYDEYDLVEKTDNTEGQMTKETIEVKYYYRKRSKVKVKYLEKETNYAIEEEEEIKGYINDPYKTEAKEVEYYRMIETTENTEGEMGEETREVIYYYEKLRFNLKVDKYVSEAIVNGEKKVERKYEDGDKLFKLEIHRKQIAKANVKIKYKIRVTNDGEIEGTADRILENIPEGYSYYAEDNQNVWIKENNINTTSDAATGATSNAETENPTVLVTRDLANEMIKPGEYKEVEIVLRWNGEEGEVRRNTVVIGNMLNPAKFVDVEGKDNSDQAEAMIVVSTGDTDETIMIAVDTIITLILAAGLIVYYKRRN